MADPNSMSRVSAIENALSVSGVQPSTALAHALDGYHAALSSEPEPIDTATAVLTVNAEDVPALVEKVAMRYVLRAGHGQARGEVGDLLARRAVREFSSQLVAVGDVLAQRFDETAATFTESLAALPELLGVEYVARQGSGTLARWEACRDSAGVLEELARQRNGLRDLGYQSGLGQVVDAQTAYADCTDLAALDSLARVTKVEGFGAWPTLARLDGVRLRWMRPAEQTAMVTRLEAERPQAKRQRSLVRP